MESAWLAAGAGGRPLAVVRVVADAAGRALVDPRMLVDGLARARDALRASATRSSSGRARPCVPHDRGAADAVRLRT